jgi:hypothetical protein
VRPAPAVPSPKASEPSPPKREIHWGWTLYGSAVCAVSLCCIAVEAGRNFIFGAKSAPDPIHAVINGSSWALAAVMLLIIQVIAKRVGWSTPLLAFYAFCMAVTGYCGLDYYSGDIRARVREAMHVTAKVEGARNDLADAVRERDEAQEDQRRAQKIADGIEEITPSQVLKDLADKADQQVRDETTDENRGKKCGDICRAAERERDGYLKRIPNAKAKEEAQKRADEARDRAGKARDRIAGVRSTASLGPVETSSMAETVGGILSIDTVVYANWEGIGQPVVLVILMLCGAGLWGEGLGRLLYGLGYGRPEEAGAAPSGLQVVAPPAKPAVATVLRLVAPPERPKRSRKPLTPEDRILQFVAAKLRPGEGKATGGAIGDALAAWWEENCKNVTLPNRNTIATVLTEKAHIERTRKGGCTWYATTIIE